MVIFWLILLAPLLSPGCALAGASPPWAPTSVGAAGMKPRVTAVFDTGPLVQTLMNAIAPVSPNGDAGYPVIFPPVNSQNQTYYYFSTPLMLSRSGTFLCGNVPYRTAEAINLVFAPGVDGIIWDS